MKTSRRSRTAPFIAMDVLAKARAAEAEGRDIVHMEVGEPAAGAPHIAHRAVVKAMARGESMGYTDGLGLPSLRAGIAALYRRRHGLDLDPGRVVVTAGSSAGFMLAFLALFDTSARVGIGDPGYPAYRNILTALGLQGVRLETGLETAYQPTPALLAEAGRLDGLMLASPANPTGTMLGRTELTALAQHCEAEGTVLISDEIYHGLEFGEKAVSALEVSDNAIVVSSFSKYYAMTGWRIGWMVVPEAMVRPIQTLAQNLFICAAHPSQIAAEAALSEEGEAEAASHLAAYARNRTTVLDGLAKLGFSDIAPATGAFYAYAGLGALSHDSKAFCAALLQAEGVATTPGLDFDPVRGHTTLRLSYAQSPERIEEGMRRLGAFVAAGCPV
ncbi:MAG: aminotransferase class I/II-fold pyridoxal phosphate-dependent enzyme [Pseudomonadota bacterium]